ncbi:MAG: cupin domain-containing protein [Gammaproteobacteria bacterium]|nr:cupin domain-containing protein [Gammaproteobacteria bacterium]
MKITTLESIDFTKVSHNPKIIKQVMIENGQLDGLVQFAKAVFPAGESATAHKHDDMAEVFLIESGEGCIRVGNRDYKLSPGTCITVEAGELHEITNTTSDDLVVIYFGIRRW